MADLKALAEKFVTLTVELEATRRQMLAALRNGAGGEPTKLNFTRPARSPSGGKKSKPSKPSLKSSAQSNHPNAIRSAKVDQEIVAMLRATPGLKTMEIAKATGSKTSTTVERLKRLMARGMAQRLGDGGYSAPPAP
jgi:hypothetical protein